MLARAKSFRSFVALAVAMSAMVAGAAVARAYTVNPSISSTWTYGTCADVVGSSSISQYPPTNISTSSTGKSHSTTCNLQFHVHAYFNGSDNVYHYYEASGYAATQIQVSFLYWSNSVYGYHQYPYAPSSPVDRTTHAY